MAKYRKMFAMKKQARERISHLCPSMREHPGIYVFMRKSEEGIKYAYVGQAKNLLERCSQHLMGYAPIDLSIKKHGLFNVKKNPFGYSLIFKECLVSELDVNEQTCIKFYANAGYQLKNRTTGGQGVGKVGTDDNKAPRGYRDGLDQGYENCRKEIAVYFEKYLDVSIKGAPNKIKERKLNEFLDFLGGKKDFN